MNLQLVEVDFPGWVFLYLSGLRDILSLFDIGYLASHNLAQIRYLVLATQDLFPVQSQHPHKAFLPEKPDGLDLRMRLHFHKIVLLLWQNHFS
jgi:hypothetical protein